MSIQDFIGSLAAWDVSCFRFINDRLFVRWISDVIYVVGQDQVILAVLICGTAAYFLLTHWKKALVTVGWAVVAVVATNLVHNQLLKLFFNRQRPFLKLADVRLCVPINDLATVSLSFPSTHAASAAALATVTGLLDPRLRWPGVGFALVIGIGTIYSGGHYPLDVLAGYMVGIIIGWGLYKLARVFRPASHPVGTSGTLHPGH